MYAIRSYYAVLQGVVNMFGTAAIAAFGVGNRLMNLFDIPVHGIANGTTSLVGRAMGAKDERLAMRVVKNSLWMVLLFEIPLLSMAFAYGGRLVRLFVADPEAIRLGDIMFNVITSYSIHYTKLYEARLLTPRLSLRCLAATPAWR